MQISFGWLPSSLQTVGVARVLLTGSSGAVGRATRPRLKAAGWIVKPVDLPDGDDLRDERAVFSAMDGCEAVVHTGGHRS
jgi:nucleoside-diphosphate-sugar epimerase